MPNCSFAHVVSGVFQNVIRVGEAEEVSWGAKQKVQLTLENYGGESPRLRKLSDASGHSWKDRTVGQLQRIKVKGSARN